MGLTFKEKYFLRSVARYEKLFGPKGFVISKNGDAKSKRAATLIEKGYMTINADNKIVVSDEGNEYVERMG